MQSDNRISANTIHVPQTKTTQPMNHFNQFALFFILGLLMLTACRETPQEQDQSVQFQRTGNSAIIRLESEPDRLTPLLTVSNYANQVMVDNIFMTLITLDPKTMEYRPALAKSRAEVAAINEGAYAGGQSYTFEIHESAVWQDGAPVTGQDYVFTLKALLNPRVQAAPYRPYAALIKDVRVDAQNPKRFTVFTDQRMIQGEEYVGNLFPLLPRHIYDPEGLLTDIPVSEMTDPESVAQLAETDERLQRFAELFSDQKYARDPEFVVGCGPYRFVEWQTGQQITLQRIDTWWGDELSDEHTVLQAHPRELIFQPVEDAATTLSALRAEELDAAYNVDPNGFEELQSSENTAERYDFFTPTQTAVYFLSLNTNDPKLADKRVRQALAHTINVQEIIDNVYNGFGRRIAVPLLPSFAFYNEDLPLYEFNIELARELLAEAGWEDSDNDGTVDKIIKGEAVNLDLSMSIVANRETSRAAGLLIQDNARRAGINIELDPMEGAVLLDNWRRGDFEITSGGRAMPSPFWNPMQNYHTIKGDNRTGFGNAETDALIEKILVTFDEAERHRLYQELQTTLHEQLPEIPLFTPTGRVIVHKRFDPEITPLFPGFVPKLLELKQEFRNQESLN